MRTALYTICFHYIKPHLRRFLKFRAIKTFASLEKKYEGKMCNWPCPFSVTLPDNKLCQYDIQGYNYVSSYDHVLLHKISFSFLSSLVLILFLEIFCHYSMLHNLYENHLKPFIDRKWVNKERDGGRGRDRYTRAVICCLYAKTVLLTDLVTEHTLSLSSPGTEDSV